MLNPINCGKAKGRKQRLHIHSLQAAAVNTFHYSTFINIFHTVEAQATQVWTVGPVLHGSSTNSILWCYMIWRWLNPWDGKNHWSELWVWRNHLCVYGGPNCKLYGLSSVCSVSAFSLSLFRDQLYFHPVVCFNLIYVMLNLLLPNHILLM